MRKEILAFVGMLLCIGSSWAQQFDRIETYTYYINPNNETSDTVLSSVEYYDDSGKITKTEEFWYNNGWYAKTQYFDNNENLIRKTLMLGDSAYYVETKYDLDNMGRTINEHISSSRGEKFVMAYSNSYENELLKEAKMMYVNLSEDKEDEGPSPKGRNTYAYDDDGNLIYLLEEFSDEKNIETRYFYSKDGTLRTQHKRDFLNEEEWLINYTYDGNKKLINTITMHNGEEISNTVFKYQNGRIEREITQRNDNSKEVIIYFYISD